MFYLHICTMLSLRWFSSTLCAMASRARVRSCAIWDIEDPPASHNHRNAGKISHQPSAPFLFRGQCCSQDLLHSCEFLLDAVDSVWGQTVKPSQFGVPNDPQKWRFFAKQNAELSRKQHVCFFKPTSQDLPTCSYLCPLHFHPSTSNQTTHHQSIWHQVGWLVS